MKPVKRFLHWLREPVNALSHAAGVLLSISGMILLLVDSQGDPWRIFSFTVYGLSAIALFTASTLLHGLRVDARRNQLLRRLDHAAIFVFIAGSYTPVALVSLRPEYPQLAWLLFGFVWLAACAGVLFKLVWFQLPRWVSTAAYLVMAWAAASAFGPLNKVLSAGGMAWLLTGGAFYTVGAVIYAARKPDFRPGVFGYHELWHFFVLAGSICHFLLFWWFVL